jgi:hypothetical protein
MNRPYLGHILLDTPKGDSKFEQEHAHVRVLRTQPQPEESQGGYTYRVQIVESKTGRKLSPCLHRCLCEG